jgi:succinoglycan biosynthesis protein ExoA
MTTAAQKILAVIPCLNEEPHLEKLVRGLAASTLPLRIVIADGGSTDRSPEIGKNFANKFSNVVFLENPKRLQSSAVNLAVSNYGQDCVFLIRIDAHGDYPDDYCHILIEEAETTQADSVVVRMSAVGKKGFQRAVAAAQNSKLGNGGSAHRCKGNGGKWVDHGHHALMRLEAFRAVGGYDKSFSHNEDAELDTRLRRAGYKIWLSGKTAFTYYPRSSPFGLFRQYIGYGYGRARNIIKNRTLPKRRQLAPAVIAPICFLALATPLFWTAALPFTVWAGFCCCYGLWLGIKKRNFWTVAAGPAAMLMHLGWSLGFWRGILATSRSRS